MEETLLDYLHKHFDNFETNEEEKKIILEYIEELDKNMANVYSFVSSDKNKLALIKSIEKHFDPERNDG